MSKANWSYSGTTGPDRWDELDPAFSQCRLGQRQSPIDVPSDAEPGAPVPRFRYGPVSLDIHNNGHGIQFNILGEATLELEGSSYALRQFHFHTPSEHTLAGIRYDMEGHLVHESHDGKLLVVGLLLSVSEEDDLDGLFQRLPERPGDRLFRTDPRFNPGKLLPPGGRFYHYDGSLTTPPCTEDVAWVVFKSPLSIASEALSRYRELYVDTNRPVQPLNDRKIRMGMLPAMPA